MVVGWAIADIMRASLVCQALRMAHGGYLSPGAVFHSDGCSQYTSTEFEECCTELGVTRSIGRTGVCLLTGSGPLALLVGHRLRLGCWISRRDRRTAGGMNSKDVRLVGSDSEWRLEGGDAGLLVEANSYLGTWLTGTIPRGRSGPKGTGFKRSAADGLTVSAVRTELPQVLCRSQTGLRLSGEGRVVGLLVFDRGEVSEATVQPGVVVPVDPSGGGVLDVGDGAERLVVEDRGADALGLVQPDDGLHQGIVERLTG